MSLRSRLLVRAAAPLAALLLAAAAPALPGCDGTGTTGTAGQQNPPTPNGKDPIDQIYARATTKLTIEIDYQPGAEPYTGSLLGMDTWNLFTTNVNRLFQGAGKTLTVPTTLPQMEKLATVTGTEWNVQAILEVAAQHRAGQNTTDTASFYFVYFDGYFKDDTGVRKDVLGVSLGNTGILAMFKPVIEASTSNSRFRMFVEQSTLIHEFGHAIGLVDNGVTMVKTHKDTPHGAHCTSDKCVMYWANEGAASALQFVQQYLTTGNEILYDTDCLNDVQARIASER